MKTDKTRERIAQIIGEASMLWSEEPKGVFNSEGAELLVDEIMAHIEYPIQYPEEIPQMEGTQKALDNLSITN